jgi:hypothetical protein
MTKLTKVPAYIDCIAAGLVPCMATALTAEGVTLTITADRPGYKRGDTLTLRPWRVVPRKSVYRRDYGWRIRPYEWADHLEPSQ